jgi:hypothetical protein
MEYMRILLNSQRRLNPSSIYGLLHCSSRIGNGKAHVTGKHYQGVNPPNIKPRSMPLSENPTVTQNRGRIGSLKHGFRSNCLLSENHVRKLGRR